MLFCTPSHLFEIFASGALFGAIILCVAITIIVKRYKNK